MKPDNITGVYLDADLERLIEIDLPLVRHVEKVYYEGNKISDVELEYGEFEFIGDIHYGNEALSRTVLDGYLKYLEERPHILIGLMGDIVEYGEGSNFIRADQRVTIDDQIEMFLEDFKPFANRIKFILWGNHEERVIRKSKSKRLMRVIALELGLKPGKDVYVGKPQRGVFVVFKAGEKSYGAQVRHSKTSARVNQEIQLKRAGSQNVASIIAHGHTHRMSWIPRTFRSLEVVGNRVKNVVRRQYLLATGCFLKYPGYAEASDYPYTDVGAPIVRFFSQENNLQEYDLTGFYRNYLSRGDKSSKARVKLSISMSSQIYTCPDCASTNTIKWSNHRRRCKECNRTFGV